MTINANCMNISDIIKEIVNCTGKEITLNIFVNGKEKKTKEKSQDEIQDMINAEIEKASIQKDKIDEIENRNRKILKEVEELKNLGYEVPTYNTKNIDMLNNLRIKGELINDVIPTLPYYNELRKKVCQDGTISIDYRGLCIIRLRGKGTINVAFASKYLDDETINKLTPLPESYNRTHNRYLLLNSREQFPLILDCMNQSVRSLDRRYENKINKKYINLNEQTSLL